MPSDARKIFLFGGEFQKAADSLLGGLGPLQCVVPRTVLIAFAAELYLKCLATLETGKTPYGHDLAKLVSGLSQASKDALRADYEQHQARFDTLPKPPRLKLPNETFEEALQSSAHAFEAFRYAYEIPGKAVPNWTLPTILPTLRRLILALQPGWG